MRANCYFYAVKRNHIKGIKITFLLLPLIAKPRRGRLSFSLCPANFHYKRSSLLDLARSFLLMISAFSSRARCYFRPMKERNARKEVFTINLFWNEKSRWKSARLSAAVSINNSKKQTKRREMKAGKQYRKNKWNSRLAFRRKILRLLMLFGSQINRLTASRG